jgi:hypothetical protein
MTNITDEYMQDMLTKSKEYTMVLLKPGPNANSENVRNIIWEHARKNFSLRADGILSIVAPITIEADVSGLYVFNAPPDEIPAIMNEDPAVKAGIFVYEIYPCRSFPGDSLGS